MAAPAPLLWDLSPVLGPDTPAFPGDQGYEQVWTARIGPGCPVNLSALRLSPHLGSHADAPLHYRDGAPAVAALSLDPFLGPCRVIHALDAGPLILPEHLTHALPGPGSRLPQGPPPLATGLGAAGALPPRVLVRTRRRAPTAWSEDFTAFAPETLDRLADLGVRLVGIDSQSVDPADSKTLPSHQRLLQRDLRVLENLVLDEVPEGDYELIALPLRLELACASPVRAVLRPLPRAAARADAPARAGGDADEGYPPVPPSDVADHTDALGAEPRFDPGFDR